MKYRYLSFIFLFGLKGVLFAQTYIDSSLVGRPIVSIEIAGNQTTKSSIILREMTHKETDSLDLDIIEMDRKRIQSLNLFNRVIIIGQPDNQGVGLLVSVTEQWYIIPYPILHINEKDWGKISYGFGIRHLNFRGRAETISFEGNLGYNPKVELEYTNPWIAGRHNLLTSINCFYKRKMSKHYEDKNVNENHIGGNWTLGKRWGHHFYTMLYLGYRKISFSTPIPGQTHSPSGTDRFPILGIGLYWDYRDLSEYPHSGWRLSLYASKAGYGSLPVNYSWTGMETRKYFPIFNQATLAFRTLLHLSQGKVPLYDRIYLGYSERIRGHFFETVEGENRALAGLVFRFPLIPIRYYDLSDMEYLTDLKFGISMGLFADTGLVWFQNEEIKSNKLISGYGFGLHFHFPYIHVLRLDLAFDEEGNTEFIVDLGVDI
jgi:outer membrane protein assembly factor BamA